VTLDTERHHRRRLRLKGYDYAQDGAYYVTICTQNRLCLFGDIVDGTIRLNAAGSAVQVVWNELPLRFARLELDTFVVMPNHIHGIAAFVGAGLALPGEKGAASSTPTRGDVVGGMVGGARMLGDVGKGAASSTPTRGDVVGGMVGGAPTLGDVIRAFKSLSAIHVNRLLMRSGPLWQRNYYEHVIRDEDELNRIRDYITNNPMQWGLDRENPGYRDMGPGLKTVQTKDDIWR
jgi:REP element-mobilizing transposase RayT